MNLRSVDLNLLVVFDAVFRIGSTSVAARQIGMSQPAVSNALTRFRSVIGDPLFVRHPLGLTPTEKAKQLAPVIRQALGMLETTLKQDVDYDYAVATTDFILAMEEWSEILLIPNLVQWLREVAPGVRVSISEEKGKAAYDAMRKGTLDMSITYERDAIPGDFKARILFEDERVCLVRNDHGIVGHNLTPQTYLEIPHVVLNQQIRGMTGLSAFLVENGWQRNIAMQVASYLSVPAVLIRTDMIATMPKRMAMHLQEYYPLRILDLPFKVPPLAFFLRWHESKTADPRHAWMRRSIINLAGA
jgi:DNA-binding transcriptional LysR family regulator